jgi:hypothetical protein
MQLHKSMTAISRHWLFNSHAMGVAWVGILPRQGVWPWGCSPLEAIDFLLLKFSRFDSNYYNNLAN